MSEEPDYTAMSTPEMMVTLKDDLAKWAVAFCQHESKRGCTGLDARDVQVWFAWMMWACERYRELPLAHRRG
jgi:hypothetical protein